MKIATINNHYRRHRVSFEFLFILTSTLVGVVGCGHNRPECTPVSGQVLIDGKPLAGGFIRLYPTNARAASAEIGPDGCFTLKTFEAGDGAVLGVHPVSVSWIEDLSDTKRRWRTPKKYADPTTSGLTVSVDKTTDTLTVNLSWEGGIPFVEKLVNGKWQ